MVTSTELSPSLQSGHQVAGDNTGCRPVLWGGISQIRHRKPGLLDEELGDLLSGIASPHPE